MPKLNKQFTITDAVQGVVEWSVERKKNSGEYTFLKLYTCLSQPIGEMEVYNFACNDILSSEDFIVGDSVQYRFTPTGYDSANGLSFESITYILTSNGLKPKLHNNFSVAKFGL